MEPFRIGIIGAGAIVEGNHLPAIQSLPQSSVVWIYDRNPARMALVTRMYGIPALTDQPVDNALERVDICLLATPYGSRPVYIDRCRQLGKALVVEKPFAFSKEEHLAHCKGFRDWEIAVNFQRRFYRSVAILRQVICGRLFGGLRSVRFVQGNFTLKGGSGYLSSVELAGGGVIAESSSHALDILLSVTDARAVRLLQLRSFGRSGLDYDTVFDSEITTDAGKIDVHCEISTLRNLENGLYLQFESALVSCDLSPNGQIFVRDPGDHRVQFSVNGEALRQGPFSEGNAVKGFTGIKEIIGIREATGVNEAFLAFWQAFLEGMRLQQANRTSAYDSLLTSEWIGAIYKKINRA